MRVRVRSAVVLAAGSRSLRRRAGPALRRPRPSARVEPTARSAGAAGLVSGLAGKACTAVAHPGRVLGAGKKLLGGHVGGAAQDAAPAARSQAPAGGGASALAAVGAWVLGGARPRCSTTAKVIDEHHPPAAREHLVLRLVLAGRRRSPRC